VSNIEIKDELWMISHEVPLLLITITLTHFYYSNVIGIANLYS